jgi:hypothetical protein
VRRSGHRLRFLILLAIFFGVKICFDIQRIHQYSEQDKQLIELEKSTAETARKLQKGCEDMVQTCTRITGKPCEDNCSKGEIK